MTSLKPPTKEHHRMPPKIIVSVDRELSRTQESRILGKKWVKNPWVFVENKFQKCAVNTASVETAKHVQ